MSHDKPTSKKATQILDAARRLFAERGFGATNMDALATAAAVSKATIYAHYDSKEALFAATARHECERLVARMAIGDGLGRPRPLAQALTDIGRVYLDKLMSPRTASLARMVIAETSRFPELGEIFYASAPARTLASIDGYFKTLQQQGALVHDCDTRRAADQFLSLLRGDLYIRILLGCMPSAAERDRTIDSAVQAFIALYGIDDDRDGYA